MAAQPAPQTGLANFELEIRISDSVVIRARPKYVPDRNGNAQFAKWIIPLVISTPFGPVDVTMGMDAPTFDALLALVRKYQVVPRLSQLLEGTFGMGPMFSVNGRKVQTR